VKVHIQEVQAFSEKDAESQIDVDAWQEFVTDEDGCLPISWHGGEPRSDELHRVAVHEREQAEADERDIEKQLAEIRKTLKPRRNVAS
jgi:hypothetical protein